MSLQSRRVAIYGAPRSGKTTLAEAIVARARRLVVFDPMDHVSGLRVASVEALRRHVVKHWRKPWRLRIVPADGQEQATLSDLASLALRIQEPYRERERAPRLVVFVDEIDAGYPSTGRDPAHAFTSLCRRGGHYAIDVVATTQRPASVHPDWRGNVDAQAWFRLFDHLDLAAARRVLGAKAAELPSLPVGAYFWVEEGRITRRMTAPKKRVVRR